MFKIKRCLCRMNEGMRCCCRQLYLQNLREGLRPSRCRSFPCLLLLRLCQHQHCRPAAHQWVLPRCIQPAGYTAAKKSIVIATVKWPCEILVGFPWVPCRDRRTRRRSAAVSLASESAMYVKTNAGKWLWTSIFLIACWPLKQKGHLISHGTRTSHWATPPLSIACCVQWDARFCRLISWNGTHTRAEQIRRNFCWQHLSECGECCRVLSVRQILCYLGCMWVQWTL